MRKWLNKPWVVALLVVAAALGCWDQWPSAAPAGTAAPESTPVNAAVEPVVASPEEGTPTIPSLGAVSLAGPLREVFPVRVVTESRPETGMPSKDTYLLVTLSALWSQGAQRLAVINDTIVREGQRLEHYSIDRFEGQGVWLRQGETLNFLDFGKTLRLRLPLSSPSLASSPSP